MDRGRQLLDRGRNRADAGARFLRRRRHHQGALAGPRRRCRHRVGIVAHAARGGLDRLGDGADRGLEQVRHLAQRLALLAPALLQIDADGEVHVEHRRLHERRDLGADIRRRPAAEPARRAIEQRGDQLVDQEGVAADVPARLQAERAVGAPDLGDRGGIGLVERRLGDQRPVLHLPPAGVLHAGGRGEQLRHLRRTANVLIELVERARHAGLDHRLQLAQMPARLRIDAHERHTFCRRVVGSHNVFSPFRRRIGTRFY